jgi:hypothetical protein
LQVSLSKDLPPLPPLPPSSAPSKVPPALSMDDLVAQIRSPEESPVESTMPLFTPPVSNRPSPVPDRHNSKIPVRRRPTPQSQNPMAKIQELSPEALSRKGSEDTVVTTLYIPSTPPDSPDHLDPLAPLLASTRIPTLSGLTLSSTSNERPLKHSPSLPTIRKEAKRAASDSALHSPPTSPFGKSPVSPHDSKLNYSLFPPPARPSRPRRLTTS